MDIGIDIMGGDFAPDEAVKGIALYASNIHPDVTIHCLGDEETVKDALFRHGLLDKEFIKVHHAPDQIGYHEPPTKAFKEKPNSSLVKGFQLLAQQSLSAFISAGNTGAMLVGAMFSVKVIEGVMRPTVSGILPKPNGGSGVLLDAGLNIDCKPEHLNQFAILGSLYSKHIFGVQSPRVGLVNIGEEEGKGNSLVQAVYPMLKENKSINFIGNIEGRDFFWDKADVMVCDGFTGNVILKTAETFYDIAKMKGIGDDEYIQRFHYENYGGSPVIGISKPVIIGHGISSAKAFKNMIWQVIKMIESDLCGKIKEEFTALA